MKRDEWFSKLTPGEQVNHYFCRCSRLHKCIVDKNMTQTEIYAAQHRMLAMLNFGPMKSQKEIADEMGISTATVAVTLKKMEKSGYVEKIMDADDNRLNKIKVTEKGKQTMYLGFDIINQIDKDAVRDFTEEELKQFTGFMERYAARLNEMADIDYMELARQKRATQESDKE